jgi:hypothetical protein
VLIQPEQNQLLEAVQVIGNIQEVTVSFSSPSFCLFVWIIIRIIKNFPKCSCS